MQRALITHDFTLVYVDNNDSTFTPLLYRITAMWSDLAGSILLWALILSGYLAAMWFRFRNRRRRAVRGVGQDRRVPDGRVFLRADADRVQPLRPCPRGDTHPGPGPDPLLQDRALVAFHPPLLYLGLVGFTVPFCLAVASLVTGQGGGCLAP